MKVCTVRLLRETAPWSNVEETGVSYYNFQLTSFFGEEYVRCIISVNVYIKFIIRVNKTYYTIDIPHCS